MSSFSPADRQSTQREQGLTETRSIDYIPDRERHGHPFSQFTLWFGGNLQITAIVTGALAVICRLPPSSPVRWRWCWGAMLSGR